MPPSELRDMIVADIMARWPQTIPVFLRRRMNCPGCPMAPFMTAAEAAREYELEPDDLAGELARAIAGGAAGRAEAAPA